MQQPLTPLLETAREILDGSGRKGLHISMIAKIAVDQNKNMGLPLEEFQKKIGTALAANLKTKKPRFASVNHSSGPRKGKPKQGWYRLKEERTAPAAFAVNAPQPSKNFLGKAGEYAVMSELLFWEFNVSSMIVDDGIDLVASKDNKFFHIQVKTSSCPKDNVWRFTISKASFMRYNSGNVFYVFVLRKTNGNEFIIIPSPQINYMIHSSSISDAQTLSLNISCNEKKKEYILNGQINVTPYLGDFGGIIV